MNKRTTKEKKDEELKKEKHKAFIQEQLDHRDKVDEETVLVQQTLIKKKISPKLLEICMTYLIPKAFEEVAEERSLLKLCGNCLCDKPLQKEEKKKSLVSTPKPKFYLSLKGKKIFDYEQVSWFCSETCYVQYQSIYSIISTESLYSRSHQTNFTIVLQSYKDEIERETKRENINNEKISNLNQLKNSELLKREIEMLSRDLNNINFPSSIKEVIEKNEERVEEIEQSNFEKWLASTINNNEFNSMKSSFDNSYMHEIHSDSDLESSDSEGEDNSKRKRRVEDKPIVELSVYAQLFELLSNWKTKKTVRFLKQKEIHKEVSGFIVDPEKENDVENEGKFLYALPISGNDGDLKKESLLSQLAREIGEISTKLSISKDYCYNIADNIVSTFNIGKAVQKLPQQYVKCLSMLLIHLVAVKNTKYQLSIENNQSYIVSYLRSNKLQSVNFQYLLNIFE